MALRAMSRLTNVEKSLNAYLFTALVTGHSYTVIFPRETFGDTLPGLWIEPSYVPLAEEFSTRRVHIGWGYNRLLLANINIFEQRQDQIGQSGGAAGQYTMSIAVDRVCDALGPRAAIPIKDYATSGNPTVAYFGWRQLRSGRVRGLEANGLEQWNVSATLVFSEEHT